MKNSKGDDKDKMIVYMTYKKKPGDTIIKKANMAPEDTSETVKAKAGADEKLLRLKSSKLF